MGLEIANRIAHEYGDGYDLSDVAQYHIEIGDLPIPTNTISHKSGSATFDTASTGEVVVTVDWSDISGLTPAHPTELVADVLVSGLVSTYPGIGISSPLAEVPIHLIGHSRGASVVGALAENLGKRGIWVDQVTHLDTHPITIDWGEFGDFSVTENVVFADSYWREGGFTVPNGEEVDGAYNGKLNDDYLNGDDIGYGGLSDQHSDVHLWYHGTIDTVNGFSDGSEIISATEAPEWYSSANGMPGPRDEVGYNFSRIGGGTRPSSGLASEGADRVPLSLSLSGSNVWDNVEILGFSDNQSVIQGNDIGVSLRYEDRNWDATVTVGYDTDANPYNSNSVAGVNQQSEVTAWHTNPMYFELSTGGLAAADYYVFTKITNNTHTRYFYAPGKVTVQPNIPQQGNDFSVLDLSWTDQDEDGVVEVGQHNVVPVGIDSHIMDVVGAIAAQGRHGLHRPRLAEHPEDRVVADIGHDQVPFPIDGDIFDRGEGGVIHEHLRRSSAGRYAGETSRPVSDDNVPRL